MMRCGEPESSQPCNFLTVSRVQQIYGFGSEREKPLSLTAVKYQQKSGLEGPSLHLYVPFLC